MVPFSSATVRLLRQAWTLLSSACTMQKFLAVAVVRLFSCIPVSLLLLTYLVFVSLLATIPMMLLRPRDPTLTPTFLDMLYMSVSAASSGLNNIDMERFSQSQLIVLAIVIIICGEIFVSVLDLMFRRLLWSTNPESSQQKQLGRVVFYYHLLFHVIGSVLLFVYFRCISSGTRNILRSKGLDLTTFSVFTVASSFANVGLIPTNENMMAFNKYPALFLLLIPHMLAGSTLFPVFLRGALRCLGKRSMDGERLNYYGLLSARYTVFLTATVIGFLMLQVVMFCTVDWRSKAFDGLSSFEKIIGALFVAVNARHAGEGSVDFSLVSPAVLVLLIVMMFLPAFTSFYPDHGEEETPTEGGPAGKKGMTRARAALANANLSQLSYISVFVMLVCITERESLAGDPINFSVLSIIFEIVSAYGNVGLSMGYGCGRLVRPSSSCTDGNYSFSAKWSSKGKLVLIFVMLFGKLKRFHMEGGRGWKLNPPTAPTKDHSGNGDDRRDNINGEPPVVPHAPGLPM